MNSSTRNYCDAAIPVRRTGTGPPLFLVPAGNGDISHAFELVHDIDRNIPVFVLPWPSPERKQPSSIVQLATALIPLIKEVRRNGPWAIAGYSSGGILAIEIAKQLLNGGHAVSFLGLIDTYPIILNPLSETETFLEELRDKSPILKTFDVEWYDKVSKLTVTEAIVQIRKTNINLNDTDIEWEALRSKQIYDYQTICAAYQIDALPIKVHLFRASDCNFDNIPKNDIAKRNHDKMFYSPKLGWEDFNLSNDFDVVSLDGNHLTMMRDPKNRSVLGEKMTKYLRTQNLPNLN